MASGTHARDRDLVLLPILLFRLLRHRTLCRSGLSIFRIAVLFWIFAFEEKALTIGFFTRLRLRRALLGEIEFHSEIAAVTPTAVKLESAPLIIHKRQPQTFVFANRPIPSPIRIRNLIGKSADAHKRFVTDADDIVVEVVERVTHVPHEFSATFALSI